jgi:bleomycin hydrolase|tara:strand:- start:805 stop:972 length:168 start_codon:yes stop_codon:yes gene_type:complete
LLIENSWGDSKGRKGQWTLYDAWFTEHVYMIIVNKKHVPEATLAIFDQDPDVLPA